MMLEKHFALTPADIAVIITEGSKQKLDLTPIYKAVDELRGQSEKPQKADELKAAVEAAKTSTERPRTFAVAYHNPRGGIRLAHGVEYSDGEIDVERGNAFPGAYENTMQELRETADKCGFVYHIDYID